MNNENRISFIKEQFGRYDTLDIAQKVELIRAMTQEVHNAVKMKADATKKEEALVNGLMGHTNGNGDIVNGKKPRGFWTKKVERYMEVKSIKLREIAGGLEVYEYLLTAKDKDIVNIGRKQSIKTLASCVCQMKERVNN